jgi:hypothetical protein
MLRQADQQRGSRSLSGIIWLASYPKSGNTWMRAFIATYLENPDRPLRINDLPRYALGDSQVEHFERLSGKAFAEMSRAEVNRLREPVQEWFVEAQREDIFVKTHNIIAKVGDVALISPAATAGALYIVRNPLDVAISLGHHFQIPLDRAIEILCDRGAILPASATTTEQYVASWSRHLQSWLNAQGLVLHVTRYEDMRRKPIKAFGSVVEFLDLPLERARLRKALRFTSFEELKKQEAKERFVEGHEDGRAFFREGRVGSWREILSAAQVDRIVEAHGPLMRRFGYLDQAGRPL